MKKPHWNEAQAKIYMHSPPCLCQQTEMKLKLIRSWIQRYSSHWNRYEAAMKLILQKNWIVSVFSALKSGQSWCQDQSKNSVNSFGIPCCDIPTNLPYKLTEIKFKLKSKCIHLKSTGILQNRNANISLENWDEIAPKPTFNFRDRKSRYCRIASENRQSQRCFLGCLLS